MLPCRSESAQQWWCLKVYFKLGCHDNHGTGAWCLPHVTGLVVLFGEWHWGSALGSINPLGLGGGAGLPDANKPVCHVLIDQLR